ncbi:response regulator transcription factor [Vallitalea okinawensis]|uniref:response regulator transcription factor n=1 Tax=Vallitalea okinawensis TaxID=2078660 RepID=UPI000CFD76FE|nr:response regulator [Vallitalea okinawensis]
MYRLLIVDDEYEIRNGLKNYFPWETLGFQVVQDCSNGKEALQYIDNNPVDVLLCDIKLPFMSGIEVAQTLYEQKSPITVLFLSGYRDFEYARQAIKYNVKHYLVKPTKYDELVNIFTEVKKDLDKVYREKAENDFAYYDDLVIKVKRYINDQLDIANLNEASHIVGLTPNYLSKIFKDITGINFSHYLLDVKMQKSKEYLMSTQLKTYEISDKLGYGNPKNFTRTFKKHFGMSPREFRNKKQLRS